MKRNSNTLASVSKNIWHHATDNQKSTLFSEAVDVAIELQAVVTELDVELAAAQAEVVELKEELNDKRRFSYAVELALDGLKGDFIEIIKGLREKNT